MNKVSVDFQKDVLESDVPVLVDFSAEWCGPCRMIGPAVEQIAVELEGKARVVTIDVDEHADIAGRYGIMSIPALLVFKGGHEVDRMVGAAPKDRIAAMVEKHI
ncbi:MAG: thioredoxin [Fimbriimonadaceae bacterium]